jgi:acyl-CoA synthetase (AMP-forming)/AMP-acid ligase II
MRIEERLRESVARHGAYPAVIAGRASYSYAELDLKSERLAAALQQGGVGHGDRVALFMDDGWEAVVSAFAVLKAGGVVVPVGADAAAGTLCTTLQKQRPVAIATQSRLASLVAAALSSVHSVRLVVLAGGDRAGAGGTCISFAEAVGRIGRMPTVAAGGVDTDPAVVIGDEPPLTHRQLAEDAAGAAIAGDGFMLPSLAERAGFSRLVAAIDAGSAMMAHARFVREAEADRRAAEMPRREPPFGVSRLLDATIAGGTPVFQR